MGQVSGHSRKLDAYISAARLRGADSLAGELDRFAKDTNRLAEQRNRVTHDCWIMDDDGIPTRYEMTARRILRTKLVRTPTADVIDLSIKISEHIERFLKLHHRLHEMINPPPYD